MAVQIGYLVCFILFLVAFVFEIVAMSGTDGGWYSTHLDSTNSYDVGTIDASGGGISTDNSNYLGSYSGGANAALAFVVIAFVFTIPVLFLTFIFAFPDITRHAPFLQAVYDKERILRWVVFGIGFWIGICAIIALASFGGSMHSWLDWEVNNRGHSEADYSASYCFYLFLLAGILGCVAPCVMGCCVLRKQTFVCGENDNVAPTPASSPPPPQQYQTQQPQQYYAPNPYPTSAAYPAAVPPPPPPQQAYPGYPQAPPPQPAVYPNATAQPTYTTNF